MVFQDGFEKGKYFKAPGCNPALPPLESGHTISGNRNKSDRYCGSVGHAYNRGMKSRPRSVGELIRQALPPQSRDRVFSVELIGLKWTAAVGSELAARSEPASLQDGILTVRVEDVAWGRMIMKLQNEIRPRLNAAMGFRAVKRIRFVIDGKPISQTVPEAPSTFAPEPVEPSSAIIEAAESIGDSGLRESMVRTATRYLAAQIQAGKEKN